MPYDIGDTYGIGDEEEELIGDEVEDMLTTGALARRRRKVPPAVALRHSRNVATLRPREILKPRNIWLPFAPVPVATLAQGAFNSQPQVLFRPERLLWPSDTAGSFQIDQIIIGKDNQWAAGVGSVPARAFQEDCVMNEDLGLDTAQPNSLVSILATNFSAATLTGRPSMRGQSIQ